MGKRNIKGKIYLINDSLVSHDKYSKPNRRVVAINNNKNQVHIVKIKSMYDKNGNKRIHLIPIERYSFINKESGIDPKVYKKNRWGKPIKASKMYDINARLNKWDLKKISHLK